MPNVMGVLRAEIRRLARKETKQEMTAMRKQLAQVKRLLADSRRRVSELETRAKEAARGALARTAAGTRSLARGDEAGSQIRFSPRWVKKHRSKLGMSRLHYARLIGVSPQTIMGWEAGRTRPRRGALRAWHTIRGKGVRELRAMLANGTGGEAKASRGGRKRGRRALVRRGAVRARVRRAVKRARLAGTRTVRAVRVRAAGRRARAAKRK